MRSMSWQARSYRAEGCATTTIRPTRVFDVLRSLSLVDTRLVVLMGIITFEAVIFVYTAPSIHRTRGSPGTESYVRWVSP